VHIPVFVQHRHVHLSAHSARELFGKEDLEPDFYLEQRSQFVAKEKVAVIGPNGSFEEVAIIGPVRAAPQVELSTSDAFAIGVNAPLRISGDTQRAATVVLKTSIGEVKAVMSTMIPIRHIHLPPDIAQKNNLAQNDIITVQLKHRPHINFDQVVVRVHPTFSPAFHLTKDEAAAAWIQTGDNVTI
jgi:putative phosphotransacetylase